MHDEDHGLRALKACLPEEAHAEFYIFEARLKENRSRARLFGTNPQVSSDHTEITYYLNDLAIKYCGVSFTELCERQPQRVTERIGSIPSSRLRVSVELLTTTMPTAYCYNATASEFPFVNVTLDNTAPGSTDIEVIVSAMIDNYSESFPEPSTRISAGKVAQVSLLPSLKPTAVATLIDKQPAMLRIVVKKAATPQETIDVLTFPIRLHARDIALLELKMPDGSLKDLTRYLAAWVTPRHPEIEKVVSQVAQYHELGGYVRSSNKLSDLAMEVREQVKALFQVLKDVKLVYVDSALEVDAEQVTQRVRFPGDVLTRGGSANCIDRSVLFASLLMAASIDPVLVLVPGHAFVGWHIWRNIDQCEFVEMTEINKCNFEEAWQSAQSRYEIAEINGYRARSLFDSSGFLRVIDVVACRNQKIQALSY